MDNNKHMFYLLLALGVTLALFKNEACKMYNDVCNFFIFIHDHNPLLLHFYEEDDECEDEIESVSEKQPISVSAKDELYENKYLIKYHKMKNEFPSNEFLKNLMNNYVIDCTPNGNVAMRYNYDKNSFEYFSNHTIPFRYLETVGRKYVTTYNCKSIYIDLEQQINKVNEVNERIKSMKHKPIMRVNVNQSIIKKDYSNMSGVNPVLEQPLIAIKESNRYTHEGRFNDFKITKPIHNKEIDNLLNMSFKNWKKMNVEHNTE